MKPNLFILGGQKCGTTALASFLDQHSDIAIVEGKEAHVFDSPRLQQASEQELTLAYQNLSKDYESQRYLCDATPIYAYLTDIPERISRYTPDAKIIFMLRDPVDRAISHYQMERRRNIETENMLRAFLLEPKRLAKELSPVADNSAFRVSSYLDRGRFSQQLANLYRFFKPEQVLIIHNEDLRVHHQQTLDRVFDFLQVPNQKIPAKTVFSGTYRQQGLIQYLASLYAGFILRKECKFVKQHHQFSRKQDNDK
ncbi:sulfotransferase family protein [Motilimonas pumila]|uniref:Sulfotransferase n=1 Tax=Motilimonas pumila TaxID=2303987 RepID=A0A418YDW6_9GAMM|nr:sulfotransferase [Motilimonas pumila]RJG42737.1 sulfotransferase [Motilimonas pumila]